jgi:hypothetical protein
MFVKKGVRVTNVYVPLYYKKIVDGLASGVVDSSHWPWQDISVWFLLKILQGGGQGKNLMRSNVTPKKASDC